jgi:hypothetical protein
MRYDSLAAARIALEDDTLSVSASVSLTPSIRTAWEEDDGVMQATLARMLANRPILEKYNEYLSGPAKVVDVTYTHMTVVKMFNRAATPSGIIKDVEPLVPRTMRHPTTDQYTLDPPAKQINQRDHNKRLHMEQQSPTADKFKQGDFNGQGVAAPADSVYEIAPEKCDQWMTTWIEDCGRTVPKQESSPDKNTVMCDHQEVNPHQLPHKKTPDQKKLDKQMKEKAAADKTQRTAIILANRQANVFARHRTRKGLTPRTSLTPWWKRLSTVEESRIFNGYSDGVEGVQQWKFDTDMELRSYHREQGHKLKKYHTM